MNKIWESIRLVFSRFFLKIPISEKIFFAKYLSMMIFSGMTEVESLYLIRRQVKSRGFGLILDRIILDVENGQFLSEAMNRFSQVFGQLFINIIKIGELSGSLSANLDYLAIETRKSQQLHSKVRSALIYPAVILVATIGITTALAFLILPKIIPIFSSLRITLPLTTRLLISFSNFLNQDYPFIIAGFFFIAIVWFLILKIPTVRYLMHRSLFMMPIVSKITIDYNIATITRILGILLKSGIKIVEAIVITSNVLDNLVYKKALLEIAEEIKKGEALFRYFEKESAIFPVTVSRMIEVGEKTGNLESNLSYLAEFYGNEIEDILKDLSSILEPLLLVVMGVIVGFVALAIITPIYGITQGLKMK